MSASIAQVFAFESASPIRSIMLYGAPWFAAKDVCDALHLTNSRVALKALDADEKADVSLTYTSSNGVSQKRATNMVNESGLYTLILRCRDAVTPGTIPYRFRKWVTSEVLPAIRQTGSYSMRQPETLGDLTDTATTMTVRDARRSKKETDLKAAARIAEKCVPVIMREMREHQYHYSNCEVGPAEVIPALLSDARNGLQLRSLLSELADNNHDVSGAWRELEAIRHHLLEQRKVMNDLATHGQYIARLAAK